MAAGRSAALGIPLVREAAAEIEQLGLPSEALVQLRDARGDQAGRELEGLGRGAEPADVQVKAAEPKPRRLERRAARASTIVCRSIPHLSWLVSAAIVGELGLERRRIRVGERQDPQADVCRSSELLREAGDQVELARGRRC